MQTLKIRRWDHRDRPSSPPVSGTESAGFRAPGSLVLILQDGSGWTSAEDGTRTDISAKTVVIWAAGDWVHFGCDARSVIDTYWAADLSEQEWAARLAAVFGPDALSQ
jgi:hypothetical protein